MLKLFRLTFTQIFNRSNSFFDFDLFIFFFFCFSWKTLPWQASSNEVHQHKSNLLKIISPCLLDSQVCVQTCVPCCSSQSFIVFKRNMPPCSWIFISFSQSKINDVNYMLLFLDSNEKVIRFYISMKKSVLMHEFDSL